MMKKRKFGITAQTKLKHAAILRAVRKCGGLIPFAKAVGVSPSVAIRLQNLQWCLPASPTPHWPQDRLDAVKSAIAGLADEPVENLFPDELRRSVEIGIVGRTIEQTKEVPLAGLLEYTEKRREALRLPGPVEVAEHAELRDSIRDILKTLSDRERRVIELRYGLGTLDGKEHTLTETGDIIGVSRERLRQIEAKALRKLQQPSRAHKLSEHI